MSISAYDIVEQALKEYPSTRSDDRKLIMTVWWMQDQYYDEHFRKFFQYTAIMPETITRIRRKLQELGQYKADESVDEARFEKFKKVREVAPSITEVERIQSLFD